MTLLGICKDEEVSSAITITAESTTLSSSPDSTTLTAIDDERRNLQNRLEALRRRRRKVLELHQKCQMQQAFVLERLNQKQRERQQVVDEYSSILTTRQAYGIFLEYAQRWNVTNDCFHIWNNGAFAMINGCRLGLDAPPLPTSLMVEEKSLNRSTSSSSKNPAPRRERQNTNTATSNGSHHPNNKQPTEISPQSPPQQQQQQQQQRRYLGLFFSNTNGNQADTTASMPKFPSCNPRVPWLEVNAALGHACLLLKVLQESAMEKGGTTMELTHELIPMGATSKMGIRFGSNPTAAKMAVPVAFLQCIAEAAAQQQDKTIAIPHPIQHWKKPLSHIHSNFFLNGGEWTIGGLSICYSPQMGNSNTSSYSSGAIGIVGNAPAGSGGGLSKSNPDASTLEWTRACKYLLTDLKWLVAYAAKHGDR